MLSLSALRGSDGHAVIRSLRKVLSEHRIFMLRKRERKKYLTRDILSAAVKRSDKRSERRFVGIPRRGYLVLAEVEMLTVAHISVPDVKRRRAFSRRIGIVPDHVVFRLGVSGAALAVAERLYCRYRIAPPCRTFVKLALRAVEHLLVKLFDDRSAFSAQDIGSHFYKPGVFLTGHISGAGPAAPPRLIIQTRTLTAYVAREFSRA